MEMELTIICKKVTTKDGRVFISHKIKKAEKWYDICFVNIIPQKGDYIKIFDNIVRMFISVDESCCNIREVKGRNKLYITNYTPVQGEKLARYVESEKAAISKYRDEQAQLVRDFFNTVDTPPEMPEPQQQSSKRGELPF